MRFGCDNFYSRMTGLLYKPEQLDESVLKKLKAMESWLRKWNKYINLVSPQDEEFIWERHIVDSLQLIPFLSEVNKIADMGSGVGLPAVPLAIACPEIDVFAIEATQKKASLMSELIRQVRIPNLHVLPDRVEKSFLSHMDVVCCRAFGEFTRDSQLAYKMLKPSGLFMTYKTAEFYSTPEGYDKVISHAYTLPKIDKSYYVVIAEKNGEM